MVDWFDRFFADFIASIVACWFLRGALSGNFYTSGRGGGVWLVASTRSRVTRLILFIIGAGIAAWVLIDIARKIQ